MTDYEYYENNLAFPPTTDRTQSKDELVEKTERLTKKNNKLKDLLKECYFINEMVIHTFNWLETIVTPSQKYICPKVVGGINKTQQRINQVLGEDE